MTVRLAYWLSVLGFALGACDSSGGSSESQIPQSMVSVDASVTEPAIPTPDAGSRLFFVGVNGSDMGDGRRHSPYPSTSVAYANARSGDVVHLLPGDHGKIRCPPQGVKLQGSGADVTTVQSLLIDVPDTQISELSIVGGRPGLHIKATSKLSNTTIRDSVGTGILIEAHTELKDVVVLNTLLEDSEPGFDGVRPVGPAAVIVRAAGRLNWIGGVIRKSAWTGLSMEGSGEVQNLNIDMTGGVGIAVLDGTINLTTVVIKNATAAGLLNVNGETSINTLTVSDSVATESVALRAGVVSYGGVLSLRDSEFEKLERAIRLARGASATVVNAVVGSMDVDGVALDGSEATLENITIESAANTGVSAVAGSTINGEGIRVGSAGRVGFLFSDTDFVIDGLTVRDGEGRGVSVLRSGGTLKNVDISQVPDVGIQVTDPRSPVTISNGRITNTGTSGIATNGMSALVTLKNLIIEKVKKGEGDLGEGIHAYDSKVHLAAITTKDNAGSGLLAEQSIVTGDTLSTVSNLSPGAVFIGTQDDSHLVALRADDNRGYGVLVLDGSMTLDDGYISGTRSDLAGGPGEGLSVALNASVTLNGMNTEVSGNDSHGISVQGNSRLTIQDVRLEANQGYGLFEACNQSTIELTGAFTATDNQLGPRSTCP